MARSSAINKTTDETELQGRSSKEDWMKLALAALVNEGIDQVKIQVMAKTLGVSRSSFYYFFESLQDLHNQLLEFWLKRNTGSIIERAMRPAPTIGKAVLNVFEIWIDESLFDPSLDIAIRYWGRRDAHVRSVVEQADDQRVLTLTRMFMRHGFAEEEALTRARVLYFTQIGHYTLDIKDSLAARLSHVRSYVLTFTGVEPDKKEIAQFMRFCAPFL